ncbi:MAG TPA: DNA internalization-related competence protein ComEC/Rec2 [Steroidobacteraceae bacterium]
MVPRHALAFLLGILCVECCGGLDIVTRLVPWLVAGAAIAWLLGTKITASWTAGVLWALVRACVLLNQQLPPTLEGTDWLVRGDVISIPAAQNRQVRFDFAPEPQPGLPGRLQLSWFDTSITPQATEHWQLRVRLRVPRGFANPGGFDYEGALFRSGVGATGYVRTSEDNHYLSERWRDYPILALRAAIARRIGDALRDDTASGIVAGLAVGATEQITTDQWQVFTATGTTHLIAISGLHVTMVAAIVMLLVRRLWRWPATRVPLTCQADVAALAGALAAAAYALLAGFSVPTQRTLAMLIVGLASQCLRRAQPASHVLSLALFAVLLLDPHAALSAGFWLSFVAVAVILALLGGSEARPHPLRAFLATQRVVSLALLPATLLLFGTVSLIAPIANLVAIPAFSGVLVPLTLLGTLLLGCAPALAKWLFALDGWCVHLLWALLERAASIPSALVHLPAPTTLGWLLLVFAVLVALCPLPWGARWPPLLLVPVLIASPSRMSAGDFTLTVLDVGQGLAAVVRTRSHVLLFDAGPRFRNTRSAGELAVVPYLGHVGVRHIDLLVISHADADHSGGVSAVERLVSTREIRLGGHVAGLLAPAADCTRGEAWTWDDVHFEFLSPGGSERWSRNDGSCVLEISNATSRALLTGDIEAGSEQRIAALGLWSTVDAIVVPHHGSASSSSAALVDAVAARYAIVSAGAHNRWHFPHAAVVARWCRAGAEVINTADWGAITLEFAAHSGLREARSQRLERPHYWSPVTPRAGRSLCAEVPAPGT